MSVELAGFVDRHAHLLRTASGNPPAWRTLEDVRRLHERCAAAGITPVDEPEPTALTGLAARLLDALEQAARVGLVEVWEAGVRDWHYLDALLELREAGPLPARVRLLAAAGLAEHGMRARTGDPWCDVVGVKLYADGWLGTRTCALSRGFLDEDTNTGFAFETADSLVRRIEPHARAGWLIATHAIGDRAIESVLDAYERVWGDDCAAAAPRIEHAQLLRPDLVERMAGLGAVACIQPGFGADDHADALRAVGDGWPDAYRWTRLLDTGVPIVTGSDYPIDALAPLEGLRKLAANPFDPMDLDVALDLMTDGAAGTVRLSHDPRSRSVEDVTNVAVLGTTPAGSPGPP
jgi:predicted amidohydrolase YtcJ